MDPFPLSATIHHGSTFSGGITTVGATTIFQGNVATNSVNVSIGNINYYIGGAWNLRSFHGPPGRELRSGAGIPAQESGVGAESIAKINAEPTAQRLGDQVELIRQTPKAKQKANKYSTTPCPRGTVPGHSFTVVALLAELVIAAIELNGRVSNRRARQVFAVVLLAQLVYMALPQIIAIKLGDVERTHRVAL